MGKASFSVGKLTQHSQSHINRENGLNYAVVENSRANSFNKYYEYFYAVFVSYIVSFDTKKPEHIRLG